MKPKQPRDLLAPFLVGLAALIFYLPGLSRQPIPGDASVILTNSVQLTLNSYAQTHPLFLVAGHWFIRLLPVLRPPTALSLLTALCAAVTIALVYATVRHLGAAPRNALFGAAALMVAHTMWNHAVFPEIYSMNAMFMAAMLYCVLRWYSSAAPVTRMAENGPPHGGAALCLGIFAGALGCANHLLVGLSLAVVAVWVLYVTFREGRALSTLLRAGMAGVIGLSFLGVLFVRDAGRLGFPTAAHMLLFGGGGIRGKHLISYAGHMVELSPRPLLMQSVATVGLVAYNFAGPQLLMLIAGTWRPRIDRRIAGLLLALFVVHTLFAATYSIHIFWAYLLPAWTVGAVMVGLGADRLLERLRPVLPKWIMNTAVMLGLMLILPTLLYLVAPHAAAAIRQPDARQQAYHGKAIDTFTQYKTYLWPPKHNAGATAEWLRRVIVTIPRDATLMLRPAHHATAHYLQQVEGLRPDLHVTGVSPRQLRKLIEDDSLVYTDNLKVVDDAQALGIGLTAVNTNGLWRVQKNR